MAVNTQTQKIVLPTVRSEVTNLFKDQKFGIIGPAGIGKSALFSNSNGLYIQTEAGLSHLSVMSIPCYSWDDFKEIYGELLKADQAKKLPYEIIIIDTIDRLVEIGNEEVVKRGRAKFPKLADQINTIGDVPNGAGWSWSTDLIGLALKKLEELGCAVAFIGHLESKEVKSPTDKYHKQTISIGGKQGGQLVAWPDHLLNIEADIDQTGRITRVVRTRPTRTIEAKSRGGIIPDGWRWADSDKENWEKLRSFFK